MAVVGPEPKLGASTGAQQPFGVCGRHDSILTPLDKQDGRGDLHQVEAPWRDEGDVIVDQPVGTGVVGPARISTQ